MRAAGRWRQRLRVVCCGLFGISNAGSVARTDGVRSMINGRRTTHRHGATIVDTGRAHTILKNIISIKSTEEGGQRSETVIGMQTYQTNAITSKIARYATKVTVSDGIGMRKQSITHLEVSKCATRDDQATRERTRHRPSGGCCARARFSATRASLVWYADRGWQ